MAILQNQDYQVRRGTVDPHDEIRAFWLNDAQNLDQVEAFVNAAAQDEILEAMFCRDVLQETFTFRYPSGLWRYERPETATLSMAADFSHCAHRYSESVRRPMKPRAAFHDRFAPFTFPR